MFSRLTLLALTLLMSCQSSFGFYFFFANNTDPKGRRLPSKIAIAVYPSEKKFKQFLKDQRVSDKSRHIIIKYGPIFGKVTGKLAAPVVEAAVTVGTGGNIFAGMAAGGVTQQGMVLWWKGVGIVAKVMGGPIRTLQQKIESVYYYPGLKAGINTSKFQNPVCKPLKSMAKKEHLKLSEDKPKPMYVVIYNLDTSAGKDYEILFNKYLYPMGPNPEKGKFYTGAGKARGGPFASWVITTHYVDTPVFVEGVPIKDASGKLIIDPETGDYVKEKKPLIDSKTGKQKIDSKVVADLTMIHDRGGIDCETAGKNQNNAPDQGGTLATDTMALSKPVQEQKKGK